MKPSKLCAKAGCTAIVPGNQRFCDAHTRAKDTRPSAAQRGYDHGHRKNRRWQLAAYPLCAECERNGRTTAATVLDHIVPLRQGGPDEPSNWQSLCESCHNRKAANERWNGQIDI
jgi:5-methylcytosine-specific restriction protein A